MYSIPYLLPHEEGVKGHAKREEPTQENPGGYL